MATDPKTLKAKIKEKFDAIMEIINDPGKATFNTVNLVDQTGASIPVYYKEDQIAKEIKLFSDEAMSTPLSDGAYTGPDGATITVASGVVTDLTAAPPAGAGMEEMKKLLEQNMKAVSEVVSRLDILSKEHASLKQANENFKNVIGKTLDIVKEIAESPAAEATEKHHNKFSQSPSSKDKIDEMIANHQTKK